MKPLSSVASSSKDLFSRSKVENLMSYVMSQLKKISSLSALTLFCSLSLFAEEALPAPSEPLPSLTVHIPMRDGAYLPTDIYFPALSDSNERFPCILVRTPAGKENYKEVYVPLAQAGYVVAIQDTRSRIDSEGKTFPFVSDGWGPLQDGYDTVEWLGTSTLTNGKVGTMGFSAMGITQLLMAPTAPPHLCCQYIGTAVGSLYHYAIYPGGTLLKNQVESWLGFYAPHPSVLQHVLNNPHYNDFWKGLDSLSVTPQVRTPGILYTGWYDTFLQGTLEAFSARQHQGAEGAKGQQKLIIGPWTHFWPKSFAFGDFEMPAVGKFPPLDFSPLRWFNHYLKGVENGVPQIPTVTYFVMGPFDDMSVGNVWKTADQWPIAAKQVRFYPATDGKLLEGKAPSKAATVAYAYDPNDPVPTIGGQNLFLESGPRDQRPIEKRSDVVVFSTGPLKENVEVTGPISAFVTLSRDCDETDLVVRLTDVYPDGRSILISDGACRDCASSGSKPHTCKVDLWSTSMVFAKGHQIRVSITSSNHPRFERHLNVASQGTTYLGAPLTAHNTIHLGSETYIQLPVVK